MAKLFYEVQNFTSVSVALGSLNPTRDNRLRGTKLLFPTWRIGGREESKEGAFTYDVGTGTPQKQM